MPLRKLGKLLLTDLMSRHLTDWGSQLLRSPCSRDRARLFFCACGAPSYSYVRARVWAPGSGGRGRLNSCGGPKTPPRMALEAPHSRSERRSADRLLPIYSDDFRQLGLPRHDRIELVAPAGQGLAFVLVVAVAVIYRRNTPWVSVP